MNPKPFAPLNHFTVPCAMGDISQREFSINDLDRTLPLRQHRRID
jgi:hypothetical protein